MGLTMKLKNIFIAALVFSAPAFTNAEGESNKALSATEVMTLVDEREDGESAITNSTMVLIDKKNRQRIRNLEGYRKDYNDNTKSISYFQSPADIKGTTYLNYDWDEESREDDSWLYLPALQQVKRIAAGDKSDAFLGSDFTYSDINGLELSWYDYSFINESEIVDGQDCWVIAIKPKAELHDEVVDATGYLHSETWVRKDNFVQVKGKIWVKRGKKIKYFSAAEIEQIDGIWTPKKLQMITTKKDKREHATVLQINDISYNQEINDDLFKSETMQRGIN